MVLLQRLVPRSSASFRAALSHKHFSLLPSSSCLRSPSPGSSSLSPLPSFLKHYSPSSSSLSFSSLSLSSSSLSPRTLINQCNPSLVVFDKDGTLIDFDLMWGHWIENQAWKIENITDLHVKDKLFDAMGYDWGERTVRSGGALCCTPMGELYKIAVQVLESEGMERERARDVVEECWQLPDPNTMSKPLGNVKGLFRTLTAMGLKIAVCTTDDRLPTEGTLRVLELEQYVSAIVCGNDGLPAKPSPEQLWSICTELQIEPEDTIMVGDTKTDMLLGRAAGVGLTVGVLDGASSTEDLASHADVIIPSLDKLSKIIFQFQEQAMRRTAEEMTAASVAV